MSAIGIRQKVASDCVTVDKIRNSRWLVLVGGVPVGERQSKSLADQFAAQLRTEVAGAITRALMRVAERMDEEGSNWSADRIREVALEDESY